MRHLHTVFIVSSSLTATTKQSRVRLAAIPLRLGRRLRKFESFTRDQRLVSLMVELCSYTAVTVVRFHHEAPMQRWQRGPMQGTANP